ncbi:MAG: hypothetical protein LDL38_12715 [Flavobacterium piscis]|nr:hypothetical protein [Flavobacterium piscis]
MKRKTLALFIIVGSLMLTSCNQDSKYNELIVGKYYSTEYTQDIEWDDEIPISMTFEEYEEFFPNKTSISEGTMKFSIYNENGNNILIEYQYGPDTSKWNIKDGKLYYDYGIPDFKLRFKSTNAVSYTEKQVVSNFRDFVENDLTDAMKQYLVESGDKPVKIIELNENRLVTKDSDGEETIQKRIK